MKRIIIVGGVAGGASTAARLRRLSELFHITIYERSPHISFANCGLPYYVSDIIPSESSLLLASAELFKKRFNVDVFTNATVTSIDRVNKKVKICKTCDGKTTDIEDNYDYLVLSTGANPILLNSTPGFDNKIVRERTFAIRNIPDTNRLKSYVLTKKNTIKNIVVIGGGYVGLEILENLHKVFSDSLDKVNFSLIEAKDRILSNVFDHEMVGVIQDKLLEHNIHLYLNESAAEFKVEENKNNSDVSIITSSGRKVSADLIILSIGVRPDNSLAKQSNLEISAKTGGIKVDKFMRTLSDSNIYAVGDVAEVTNYVSKLPTVIPLAGPASRQGRIAAENIFSTVTGTKNVRIINEGYRGSQGTGILGIFGLQCAGTGLNTQQATDAKIDFDSIRVFPFNHVTYYPGSKQMRLKVLFNKVDSKILGAQCIGEAGVVERINPISMAIQMNGTIKDLAESEMCYAPQFGSAKDPLNHAGFVGVNLQNNMFEMSGWNDIIELEKYYRSLSKDKNLQRPDINFDNDVVVDVRNPTEVAKLKFSLPPNMLIYIPIDSLRERYTELPKDKTLHILCAAGQRAYYGLKFLESKGYKAKLLGGGIGFGEYMAKTF